MKQTWVLVAAILCLVMVPRPVKAQPDQLTQAQAADVMSDLLTAVSKRADIRVNAARTYLRETGKEADFLKSESSAGPLPKLIPYTEVFNGTVRFVQGGGAKFANPALATMGADQLSATMTELQVYNIQTFMHINTQYNAAQAMKAFLTKSNGLQAYRDWAKAKGIDITSKPAPSSPEEVASRIEEMLTSAKQAAWANAKERGISEADFEKAWAEHVAKYRQLVEQKVSGMKSLVESLTAPPPPAPPVIVNPPVVRGPETGGPVLSPTVQSSYTAQSYQAANNELWDRFDD